jgi:uncharacterized protein YcbK (DUF882 family)
MSDVLNLERKLVKAGVRYFSARELLWANRWGTTQNVDNARHLDNLVNIALVADNIREAYGSPLRVISAYRGSKYNGVVGGAVRSAHLTGHAIDLTPIRGDQEKFAWFVYGFLLGTGGNFGFSRYSSGFIHIDNDPRRQGLVTWGGGTDMGAIR